MIYSIFMVIYVEYVIIDNFLLDLFIAVLVSKLMHLKAWRALVSAIMGTGLALIYPLITKEFLAVYKILTLLMCSLPFFNRSISGFFKALFIYVIVAFIFNGLISFGLNSVNEYGYYNDGGIVGLISGGALVGYLLALKFTSILARRLSKEHYVKLTVYIGNKSLDAVGFMDSGNIATATNGKGIIFLDKMISRKIKSETVDYVYINTVGSGKIFDVIKIDKLLIYSEGKEHIYINVNAVKTNQTYQGFQILLSSNLEEVSQ